MVIEESEGWEHKHGYRLNGDGASIKYKHKGTGYVAIIEGMVNEQDDEFEYLILIDDPEEDEEVYGHVIRRTKEEAISWLENHMEKVSNNYQN